MAIRVTLECGHASMLRVRTTPQGYTHDWEVFVRGVDNADISQYVDKVVFHLHETFPKPKRILKEPPYMVKESGYAGFVIPIDVYLKNKDEPKKIQISYDLILLPSGPAFNNVIRHSEVFVNPSEEFRKKLLKGGGVTVSNSEDPAEKGESKMVPPMVSKPKLSGTDVKKHRTTDLRTSNSFADLFGNPMTLPAKVSPENKRSQSEKIVLTKAPPEKTEKLEKPAKLKHSPHKDKKKDKSADDKKDKKDKILSKEKDRVKEKSKRPPSPGNKEELSYGSVKKAAPLSPSKKAPVPPPSSVARKSPSPKPKEKEHKKMHADKDKDKMKDNFKVPVEDRKFDRKKKKHKDERSKERKEKDREKEHEKMKDPLKKDDKKLGKSEKHEKAEKEKNAPESKVPKDDRKSPKHQKDKDKNRNEKSEKNDATEKLKDSRSDKDKQKHKHKRKEKKDRNDESADKDKQEKTRASNDKKSSYSTTSPSINPLSTLLAEMPERDSSDSTHSVDDDSIPPAKSFSTPKNESETSLTTALSADASKPSSPGPTADVKNEGEERSKKEKVKSTREERDCRKRRRKVNGGQDEHAVKRSKDRDHSVSPSVEPVSSSQSPISIDIDSTYNFKEAPSSNNAVVNNVAESEQVAPDSTNNTFIEPESEGSQVFSDDYVSQLKELQQKIMTLQDNQELQRVVQVIAETGQYEITKKTFDFDLCALDRRTVLRLQQFFSTS